LIKEKDLRLEYIYRCDLGRSGYYKDVEPIENGTKLIWRKSISNIPVGGCKTNPIYYKEKIYLGTWDNFFISIDSKTSDIIWKKSINVTSYSPIIISGVIFLGGIINEESGIYGLDSENGDILYKFVLTIDEAVESLIFKDNLLIFVTFSPKYGGINNIYILDIKNNEIKRVRKPNYVRMLNNKELNIYNNSLILCFYDSIYAYDINNNKVLWTKQIKNPASNIIVSDEKIFVYSDKSLLSINANNGKIIWELKIPYCKEMVVDDINIYFCSIDGYLYAINKNLGKIEWKIEIGEIKENSMQIVKNIIYLVRFLKIEGHTPITPETSPQFSLIGVDIYKHEIIWTEKSIVIIDKLPAVSDFSIYIPNSSFIDKFINSGF
ncbi:MAG: PQQ-binding-like beta-propeller repeat protein, partial [Caldisericia bacterium]|nr:PQQ-binding-like beta-propeller repeat protein [Caldisericia bacterium]